MSAVPALVEWFREEPLPSLLPDPVIVTGGTVLLREFLAIAAADNEGGQLRIASPFACCVLERDLPVWKTLPHQSIDLAMITSEPAQARQFMNDVGGLRWRSILVCSSSRLHAKMYAFVNARGGGACLIGSHNLTRGGARTNEEAGVLFRTRGDAHVGRIVNGCYTQIDQLIHKGELYTDTLRWPSGQGAVTARR
jgi:hypothetical protein